MNKPFNRQPFTKKRAHLLNDEIRFPEVRIIGDNSTVLSTNKAIQMAEDEGLDLILISDKSNPPIVKIEDYNKFLYNQEKMEKERKKNSNKVEIKETQLSCNISDNDMNTKAKKSREFLEDGDKVKCVIQLKGRQKAMPQQGEMVMLKFAEILFEAGTPESMPKLEGGRWMMMLKPKVKK